MRGPGKFLNKESPIRGPWCHFVEKHEPASDIDTGLVDGLKVLDPERPIREAAVHDTTVVYTRDTAWLVRQHRSNGSPLSVSS